MVCYHPSTQIQTETVPKQVSSARRKRERSQRSEKIILICSVCAQIQELMQKELLVLT